MFISHPRPHGFSNIPLQSGIWDKNSIKELFLERQKSIKEYKDTLEDFNKSKEELNIVNRARNLENILKDKTQNQEMNRLMKFYESYFDEDSGNTRKQGIDQLKEYLDGELNTHLYNLRKLKVNINELTKEINNKKEAEESAKKAAEKAAEEKNKIFIPIIPINFNFTIFFRVLFSIFSFSIYFNIIDFNFIYLIFDVPYILPTLITSALLFLWESHRFYSKVKKYYTIIKGIYMYCKKKIFFIWKK
jgi:hypothetical protein